jgi:hypothetical protein
LALLRSSLNDKIMRSLEFLGMPAANQYVCTSLRKLARHS